jgi:cysteine desulfuration protein SufE
VELLAVCSVLDRDARIRLRIDLAERFHPAPAWTAARPYPEEHRVPGCESQAFVWAEANPDGTLQFHFAIENPQGISAKALAVVLCRTLAGAHPAEAAEVPPEMVVALFGEELSLGKSLGLTNMIHMVRALARRHLHASAHGPPDQITAEAQSAPGHNCATGSGSGPQNTYHGKP